MVAFAAFSYQFSHSVSAEATVKILKGCYEMLQIDWLPWRNIKQKNATIYTRIADVCDFYAALKSHHYPNLKSWLEVFGTRTMTVCFRWC
jgi:hypothetical protein